MTALQTRHQQILTELKKQGKVTVLNLSQLLDVSEVTIRKDLRFLEEQGLLHRNHGGASLQNPYASNRPISVKAGINAAVKERIAQAAVSLIGEADSVILGSGTTVQAMVKYIQPQYKLNVISSSLNTSLELVGKEHVQIIQLGGLVRQSSSSVVGPYAESLLDQITAAFFFLGVDGIDTDYGITTTNLMEAQLNQRCIKVSPTTVVLADSSKIGKRGFGRICGLDDVQVIITDSDLPKESVQGLEELGLKLILV